jgi:hypothetical protein
MWLKNLSHAFKLVPLIDVFLQGSTNTFARCELMEPDGEYIFNLNVNVWTKFLTRI